MATANNRAIRVRGNAGINGTPEKKTRAKGTSRPSKLPGFDGLNIIKKLITPLPDDYVVELLSKRKCHRTIGWGPDLDSANKCYNVILTTYPRTTVRLRQRTQAILEQLRRD
jgi:hypothetical protein